MRFSFAMPNRFFGMSSALVALALSLGACSQPAKPDDTAQQNANTSEPASGEVLRIATEGAYPPFNNTNPDGSLSGFDVDVAKALCDQMQVKCEIVAQDWDGLIPGLLAKKYDALIAGMSITPERQEKVDFTEPYFVNTMVWLAPKDKAFDPNKIENKTLGSQRSTTLASYLQEKYDGKDGNKVNLYDTYDNAYLDLKSGRNDAVLAEKVSAKIWLKDNPEGFALIGDEIDNNDNLALAVAKGNPLREKLNQALQAIKDNGELKRLEEKNFGN